VFVLGVSFALGLAAFVYPDHFATAPGWLSPWVGSALSISVVTAVLLNLLFRIGIHYRNALALDSERFDPHALAEFIAGQGALWGAPPDLVARAEFMTVDAVETLVDSGMVRDTVYPGRRTGPITIPGGLMNVSTRFDEFTFEVTIRYRGVLLEPDLERPSPDTVLRDDGQLLLARYMLGRTASKVSAERRGDQSVLTLALRN